MSDRWVVLKFGGTSVAAAGQWHGIAGLARQRLGDGLRPVLVCSALAGVTNALEALADGGKEAGGGIGDIIGLHAALAAALEVDAGDILHSGEQQIRAALNRFQASRHPADRAELLACGEWMSSRLGALYLGMVMDVAWVDARDALSVLPEKDSDSSRAWLSARCEALPDSALASVWSARADVLVTQGFIARSRDGRTALLGRGGSDTSAALIAARLGAERVEIWTDVPGMFTADPRREEGALLIRELDYAEALELAASGAKVVHPRCIRAAFDAGIPLVVRDLGAPHIEGTTISGASADAGEGIKAVTRRDDMLVMLLENLDTRQQVGFLAWVFEVISAAGVSVDLVATSETTTTIAIDMAVNHIDEAQVGGLASSLAARCKVRQFRPCSCVNLVGRGARLALASFGPAMERFRAVPLLMLSQSANDLCISLLVPTQYAADLVHRLHGVLVEDRSDRDGRFGPGWRELRAQK